MSEPMDIVSKMRLLEADHKPDGWPAVQMREISALCNMIEEDRDRLENDGVTCYEGKGGYALVDKAQWEWLHREVDRLKRELSNANREFDRVTGWGYSVLAAQPALMDVTATLP